MPTISELIATKQAVEANLLSLEGVTAVDVGLKYVDGVMTDEIAIRVHVVKKLARVSAAQRVPAEVDGVVTDVLERPYELQIASQEVDVSLLADTTHYATLQGGVSMGPSRVIGGSIYAGTLGAVVIDNVTNQHAALTNFHVACVDSTWAVGDRMVQPSRIDTGVPPGDEFGGILRATLSAHVDGAVVSIDPAKPSQATIAEINAVKGTKAAAIGMKVRKRGRTTGLTYGTVDGLAATVNVDYGDGLGVHTLSNQVSVAADPTHNAMFSDHGDSGSVIVDDDGFVVALLFAGAGAGTIGNPISAVLSELNIAMLSTKSVIKDVIDTKHNRKELIKEKELRKELIKEKEIRKELIKEKEIRKELIKEKDLKDLTDTHLPGLPPGPIPDPASAEGNAVLGARIEALEQQLGQLVSFIGQELRPDLRPGAFSGEADLSDAELAELQRSLAQQAADAAGVKVETDGRWMS